MQLIYAPFQKVEETPDGLIVEGIATTERVDAANEVVDYDSVKAQLPDYVQWGNIREMHQPIAAGRALVITPDDDARTVFLRALVVDTEAQKKIRAKVYQGFSIGGKAESKILKRDDGSTYVRRYVQLLSEISLVDRPANPDARFTLVKMEAAMPNEPPVVVAPDHTPITPDVLAALQTLAGNLAPLQKAAATDPAKIVQLIQAARNEQELAGDMEAAALLTQAIALVQQAAGEADETPADEASEPPADAAAEGQTPPMLAAAKTGNLKKAGAPFNRMNKGSLLNVWKTLGAMLASVDASVQKAMSAYGGGDTDDSASIAAAIGAEFTKAITPVAQALLNVNDRLLAIERQPAPGGPQLRPVAKQIAGQPSLAAAAKPPASGMMREQMDDLLRKSHTDPNPQLRAAYRQQYDALREQYA